LTAKHFKGEEFSTVAVKPADPKHLLFIQNGGAAPQVFIYGMDGVMLPPDDSSKDKDKKPAGPDGSKPSTGKDG
jgi:hypothetical protein